MKLGELVHKLEVLFVGMGNTFCLSANVLLSIFIFQSGIISYFNSPYKELKHVKQFHAEMVKSEHQKNSKCNNVSKI
jgi:hypothetical protein